MLLLDAHPALDPYEVAEVARVVAFALARHHASGTTHGSVDVDHLHVNDEGVVTLAPPRGGGGGGGGDAASDVRALGDLILDLLATGSPPPPGVQGAAGAPARPWRGLEVGAGAAVGAAAAGAPAWPWRGWAGARRGSSPSDAVGGAGPWPSPWQWLRRRHAARARLLQPPSAETALAEIARQANPGDGVTPPTAATIAAQIAHRVPDARPPGRRPPSPDRALGQAAAAEPPPAGPSPAGKLVFALAMAVLLGIAALAALTLQRRTQPDPVPSPLDVPVVSTTTTATVARVWPAVDYRDGVLTSAAGKFTLGRPDDVVIAGDWFCRHEPVPALLRPSTGEVFVFDRWPDDEEELPGRPVATVPGATSLRADADAATRCPRLTAVRSDGTHSELAVEAPAP